MPATCVWAMILSVVASAMMKVSFALVTLNSFPQQAERKHQQAAVTFFARAQGRALWLEATASQGRGRDVASVVMKETDCLSAAEMATSLCGFVANAADRGPTMTEDRR